MTIYEMACYPK